MPDDPKECREHAKRWAVASATTNPVLKQSLVQTEALVRARVLVDQVRLSRLATQSAIERSRESLAETSAALVALRGILEAALRRKVQRRIYALKPKRQNARASRSTSNASDQRH